MSELVVKLTKVDPKKHSVRFDTTDENAPVRSIYIAKSSLAELGADVVEKGVEITIRKVK